jgi:hypothetical protein
MADNTTARVVTKEKKARKAPGARPVFAVCQILDDQGNPVEFPKDRLNLIVATRNAAEALEVMENPANKNAFYKKVMVAGPAKE